MTAALQQSFNVMGAKFLQEEHSLVAVLARRLGFGPLMQLQISFNFSLPVRTAVLLQRLLWATTRRRCWGRCQACNSLQDNCACCYQHGTSWCCLC